MKLFVGVSKEFKNSYFFIVPKEEFIEFAKTIERIFPGESSETYYTSYRKENDENVQGGGKLRAHCSCMKANLREDGIIQPKRSSKKRSSDTVAETVEISFGRKITLLKQSPMSKADKAYLDASHLLNSGESFVKFVKLFYIFLIGKFSLLTNYIIKLIPIFTIFSFIRFQIRSVQS